MKILLLLIAVILLIAISLSFPKQIKFPEPDTSRFTGYPSWRLDIKSLDPETTDSILFLSNSIGLVIVILSIYWTFFRNAPRNTITYFHQGNISVPGTLFTASIVMYLAATIFAGIAFQIFDLGKLWSGPGMLHNMCELLLTYLLLNGGKVDPPILFWLLAIYSTVVIAASSTLKYPYDVAFFKIQGLSLDFAVTIVFIRVLYRTITYYHCGSHRPINQPLEQADDVESLKPVPTTIDHPQQLWYLFIALIAHLVGNVGATCKPVDLPLFIVFLVSYISLFQFMGYYIYIETHDHAVNTQKRYYLPETDLLTVANVSLWSFAFSLLSNRIGLDHLVN